MKSLKLNHALADLVRSGQKTSTWRLYDDKDLSVNDELHLIDKVDPNKPETWKIIGTARINAIVQKRLGDIGPEDYQIQGEFRSKDEMLKAYQGYYGTDVTYETPVKIIRFTFDNNNDGREHGDVDRSTLLTEVIMYADGGSRGNPGPSASGFAILDMQGSIVVKKGVYLGVTTNNQAEYRALKLGLEEALRMGVKKAHVCMDSLLVINQMLGIFKVKNKDLWPVHAAIKDLAARFESIEFRHVPRELNKIADAAVNEALDEELR